jgi:hypothetical protein
MMVVEQGRYVGIVLEKGSWEMAIITRSGKCRKDEQGGAVRKRSGTSKARAALLVLVAENQRQYRGGRYAQVAQNCVKIK